MTSARLETVTLPTELRARRGVPADAASLAAFAARTFREAVDLDGIERDAQKDERNLDQREHRFQHGSAGNRQPLRFGHAQEFVAVLRD